VRQGHGGFAARADARAAGCCAAAEPAAPAAAPTTEVSPRTGPRRRSNRVCLRAAARRKGGGRGTGAGAAAGRRRRHPRFGARALGRGADSRESAAVSGGAKTHWWHEPAEVPHGSVKVARPTGVEPV